MRRDAIRETISKNIRRFECRVTKKVMYEAKKFEKSKMFETEKQAQKYVDLICLERKVPQVYNSFKSV